jgi:hypothetical protein
MNLGGYGVNQASMFVEEASGGISLVEPLEEGLGHSFLTVPQESNQPDASDKQRAHCLSQAGCKGIMNRRRKIRIHIRLAAIPQPLAERFPFQTVHHATPEMTATTAGNTGA